MKIRLRDGTGTRAFKYVIEDTDRHGNVRVYLRLHGRKVRLRETPGTPEFETEYKEALKGGFTVAEKRKPASRGSLRWLIESYYTSSEYKGLGERTQTVRRGILDDICEEHGAKPYARMGPRHVKAIRDVKADYPAAANARVKALRQVFKWAIGDGNSDTNPTREVSYLKSNNGRWHSRPFNPAGASPDSIADTHRT